MFGPLNGVRTALVVAAFVAALVAFAVGFTGAAVILLLAVAIHGAGWVFLYRQKIESGYRPGSEPPRS